MKRESIRQWLTYIKNSIKTLDNNKNSKEYSAYSHDQSFVPYALRNYKKFTKLIRFPDHSNLSPKEYLKTKKGFFDSFMKEDIFSTKEDKFGAVDTIRVYKSEVDKQLILNAKYAIEQWKAGDRMFMYESNKLEIADARS